MLKQITCVALAVMFGICTRAQSYGEIQGKLVMKNDKPAPEVVVVASNGVDMVSDISDENGKYRIKPLKPGTYRVWTHMMGFASDTLAGVVVNPDKYTFVQTLEMHDLAVEVAEANVVYYRVPLINKGADHIETLLAEDLKHRATTHGGKLSNIVVSMSSDLKPAAEGGGISVRGSREGGVLYFVDGMKIRGSEIAVPASGISSVSLYSGGIPAKYGDTTGGVVIVDTKSYLEDYYNKLNQ
jgi:Carboxypeptidase regulatory-like domain/TonB-dependent Receptor Plug Domain